MKFCTSCKETKPTEDFYLRQGKATGPCKKCVIAKQKARYEANPEREKLRSREWNARNPQRAAANNKAWRESHPSTGERLEKKRASFRKYYAKNLDAMRSRSTEWKRAN